jgi:hypothetical protein
LYLPAVSTSQYSVNTTLGRGEVQTLILDIPVSGSPLRMPDPCADVPVLPVTSSKLIHRGLQVTDVLSSDETYALYAIQVHLILKTRSVRMRCVKHSLLTSPVLRLSFERRRFR